MSTSFIASLTLTGQQITIYCGTLLLIGGTVGEILLAVVFLSLRTFRQSSCAFYLTVMSIVNTGQLLTGLLTRLMIAGFAIDWTEISVFYCRFRLYLATVCSQIPSTCLCLAIMDQYFATCSRPRWQQWSNIKIAHRLIILFSIVWLLSDIPYIIFFDQVYSISTKKFTCTMTNPVFVQYRFYFITPVVLGFLPVFITSLFGIMACRNVQSIAHRTVPIVRRELDKQLTNIVLVQIPFHIISIVPYTVINVLLSAQNFTNNPVLLAQLQLVSTIASLLFYVTNVTPFYVCMCVSERFRRQFIFVLRKIFCTPWTQPNTIRKNQIVPEP